jgi:hypothetical protein
VEAIGADRVVVVRNPIVEAFRLVERNEQQFNAPILQRQHAGLKWDTSLRR